MDRREKFEDYTRSLAESVGRHEDVEGLVLLGSTAAVDRVDEWSDHDFYLVVREGRQEHFRNDLSWLPRVDEVLFAVRETEHGLKVVYRDGAVLEFAVASGPEISTFGGSPWVVVLDRADVTARMEASPPPPAVQEPDDLREFRLFLSLVLIGVGRARRGEELAGGELVRTYATERLLKVLRHRLQPQPETPESTPDPFNVFRRFEAAWPVVGAALGRAMALPVDECGARLLGIAESFLMPVWPDYPADETNAIRHRLGYACPDDAQA
jgi:hypothetical protein